MLRHFLRPYVLQLLPAVFRRACFSAQLIIILLIGGIFRNTCAIIAERGLSTEQQYRQLLPQLCFRCR